MPTKSSASLLPVFVLALASGVGASAMAENVVYQDPSDLTSLNTSLSPIVEYHRYETQGRPDDGLWETKLEGQYARDTVLLLADIGYGYRSGTEESGITDSRIRFFHVPWTDEDVALISAFGWSIDSYIPLGDVDKGLGSGNWVLEPGLLWTHNLPGVDVSPNVFYQWTWANNDLEDNIPDAAPSESRAVRVEVNLAFDLPARYWLLVTPAYTWGVKNTDDGGFIKAFTGFNISPDMSLGLEVQWNYDVREGILQDVIRGEKYHVRLQWENYF